MHECSWDALRYALAVVRAGSLTGAAKELGVNHTTVSRRLSDLEQDLGVSLFDRSTSGWQVSPIGEMLIEHLQHMSEGAFAIQRLTSADSQELRGKIRVTAPDQVIQRLLLPGIKTFSEGYPDIDIELIASNQMLDLSSREADIAFRLTDDPPPDVVGKQICRVKYGLFCRRELLAGILDGSSSVGAIIWHYDGQQTPGWLSHIPRIKVRYRVNNANVCYDLISMGMGVGEIACAVGDLDPDLCRLPFEPDDPISGFWMLTHVDMRTTARFRIFRNHIYESIELRVPLLEGREPEAWKNAKYNTL
jgi:DNA-binding transcriptional LysR family regulator